MCVDNLPRVVPESTVHGSSMSDLVITSTTETYIWVRVTVKVRVRIGFMIFLHGMCYLVTAVFVNGCCF